MNKINIKGVVSGLVVMAIFAFGLTMAPAKASAQISGFVTPYSNSFVPEGDVNRGGQSSAPTSNNTSRSNNTSKVVSAPKQVAQTTQSKPAADSSNLAANVIYGSNSFLPTGIIQWIFMAILVLIIVILARKIFGADKKYHERPMKHA